jgi:hypothetical protein
MFGPTEAKMKAASPTQKLLTAKVAKNGREGRKEDLRRCGRSGPERRLTGIGKTYVHQSASYG